MVVSQPIFGNLTPSSAIERGEAFDSFSVLGPLLVCKIGKLSKGGLIGSSFSVLSPPAICGFSFLRVVMYVGVTGPDWGAELA